MQHKLAIIGFGYMGPMHYDIISKNVPDIQVKGVHDIRQVILDKAAAAGLYTYQDLTELLSDDEIDIITLATPNDTHRDLAITCLRAGKNVVCEKPVCMSTTELSDVMSVAEETGKLFSIHHNRRWDPDYCTVKKVLQEGTIGRPLFVESRISAETRGQYGWRGYAINGGGVLLDWGIHLLDQLLDLIEEPVLSVAAHIFSQHTPDADDTVKIFMRHENNISTLCELAWSTFIKPPRWRVNGEHGTLQLDSPVDPSGWQLIQADFSDETKQVESIVYTKRGPETRACVFPSTASRPLPLPQVSVSWADYYRNIVDAIEGKEAPRVTAAQAMRVLRVIEEARWSNEHGGAARACHI